MWLHVRRGSVPWKVLEVSVAALDLLLLLFSVQGAGEWMNKRILCGVYYIPHPQWKVNRGRLWLLRPLRQKTIHHHSLLRRGCFWFCCRKKMKRNIHKIIVMYGRDYTQLQARPPPGPSMHATSPTIRIRFSCLLQTNPLAIHPATPWLPFSFILLLLNELLS